LKDSVHERNLRTLINSTKAGLFCRHRRIAVTAFW